ncbi:hypothetical protein, partial [Escherichia marmotae]|uniref:hypothetical protein n=1 Tax=Escherichia marmotae TaxID=1499973 RepID=UPI001C9ACF44
MPDATLARLIRSAWLLQFIELARFGRPDKAFTPHPAAMCGWLMRRWRVLSGLHGSCNLLQLHDLVGRIRRLRRIRRLCADG